MNLVHAKMLAVTLVVLEVCGCGPPGQGDWVRNRVQVLNQLRDDINAQYGFLETTPRVNRGPCGRFADAFRERWNARFREKVNIAFLMATNTSLCAHIVIKFPDGSYFDGGNGVMSERALLKMCPDCKIEVMTKYDRSLLNSRCENVKPVSSSTLWSAFIPRNFTRQSGSERPAPGAADTRHTTG